MSTPVRYRVVLPAGMLSGEIVVLAPHQPANGHSLCVVLNQADGRSYTVHRSRLIAVDPPPEPKQQRSVCFECGKVEGVVLDQVRCPHQERESCRMHCSCTS